MVMHGQNELLDIFLGGKNDEVVMGVYDQVLEREQQLDDIIDPYDEMSLLRGMGIEPETTFTGDICSEIEVISSEVEIPKEVPELLAVPTPSTSQTEPFSTASSQDQTENFFQFPDLTENEEFTTIDLQSFLNDVVNENKVNQLSDEESVSSYALSQYSPTSPSYSVQPNTPDTASSLGSSSGNIPSFVKAGLKQAIKSKRQKQGKEDLTIEFLPPPPEQLTEEEEMKRVEKREKNKYAAQRCREKKRAKAETLEAEVKKLQKEQSRSKNEIQKLLDEREHLMDIINVHKSVCPKFRSKYSAC
ncbi:hypothetical protein ACF0H5_003197 [Mactra antiquata]